MQPALEKYYAVTAPPQQHKTTREALQDSIQTQLLKSDTKLVHMKRQRHARSGELNKAEASGCAQENAHNQMLTDVEAGGELSAPSMEAPPPPTLLVLPPLPEELAAGSGRPVAAAGAMAGAAEAAGEVAGEAAAAAAAGAVELAGEAGVAAAFGDWGLKAFPRASVSPTPWEPS